MQVRWNSSGNQQCFIVASIALFFPLIIFYFIKGHIGSVLCINQYISEDYLDSFFMYFTELGNTFWFVGIALILLFFKKRYEFFQAALSMAIMGIIVNVSKRLIFNSWKRPKAVLDNMGIDIPHLIAGMDYHSSFTFPSGHTSSAYSMLFFLVLVVKDKRISIFLALLAFSIAFSRVYLLQHFINDVFAGAIVGMVSVYLAAQMLDWIILKLNSSRKTKRIRHLNDLPL